MFVCMCILCVCLDKESVCVRVFLDSVTVYLCVFFSNLLSVWCDLEEFYLLFCDFLW